MITLYVKIHNKTRLHYFGKTTKTNVQRYQGSGKRWLNHVKQHGYDVTTYIYETFEDSDKEAAKQAAIKFSKDHNIVESEIWANLIPETIDGGVCFGTSNGMFGKTHTKKVKQRLSKLNTGMFTAVDKDGNKLRISNTDPRYLSGELVAESKGRTHSKEQKEKGSESRRGSLNPKAKEICFYDEQNNLKFISNGNLLYYIKKTQLNTAAVYKALNEQVPLFSWVKDPNRLKKSSLKYIGWIIKYKENNEQ